MDAMVAEGFITMSPTFISPLDCIRSIIGGGAVGSRDGLLDTLLFATAASFHRSAGTPLRRWIARACLMHFLWAASRLALLPAV